MCFQTHITLWVFLFPLQSFETNFPVFSSTEKRQVCLQATTNVILCTPKNIKFVCKQQRTWFFVHRRTSSLFASNNERDSLYTEEHQVCFKATTNVIICALNEHQVCLQATTNVILCTPKNIKFVCKQQRTWFFVHRRTSSLFASNNERDSLHTEEHQVCLQATTNVIICALNEHQVCLQATTNVILCTPKNIKFVCKQQRTWLSLPHPPTPPPQPPLNPYGLRGIKYTWMRYSIVCVNHQQNRICSEEDRKSANCVGR